jgi:uncharacterized lipoprotein YbaY
MNKIAILSALSASVFLAGCLDKSSFETPPVSVKTPKGVVECQLYTHDKVLWDEAISAPQGMSISEADRICYEEGKRVKASGL